MNRARIEIRTMKGSEVCRCESILRSLPDWFGIEEAIVSYRRDIEVMDTYVALAAGELVGFITLNIHNEYSAEIQVMAVSETHQRAGIGRQLIDHAERNLQDRSLEYLQVKTLGPSRPNEYYQRTREFYAKLGFRPLEENHLWGEVNPCLMLVKHLACGRERAG